MINTKSDRPWILDDKQKTWHYYPNGDYEDAACGRPSIPGSPIVANMNQINETFSFYLICNKCWTDYQSENNEDEMKVRFNPGDTVAFDPNSFNPDFWNTLTLDQKKRYYGDLYDFDKNKPYLFTFLCYHSPQVGHCVLVNMENQKVETMRHPENFRLVGDDEC